MYTYTYTYNIPTLDNLRIYVHTPCMAGFQTMVLSQSYEMICKSVSAHLHYADK